MNKMNELKDDIKEIIELLKKIECHLEEMVKVTPKPQEIPTQKKKFDIRSSVEAFNKNIGQIFGERTKGKKNENSKLGG